MLDIKFLRQNPDVVKENIKKKFQDEKLPLVDEVIELDKRNREIKGEVEALRAEKNKVSKEIGACMAHGEKEKAEELKKKVQENATRMEELSAEEKEVEAKIKKDMMVIPNIIDPSVPIGKDDSENVEIENNHDANWYDRNLFAVNTRIKCNDILFIFFRDKFAVFFLAYQKRVIRQVCNT